MKKLIGLFIIMALLFCAACVQDKAASSYEVEIDDGAGTTTTTTSTTIGNCSVSNRFFWGTWVDMNTGDEYIVTETLCNYNKIDSCSDTMLTVSGLGLFEKQSDNIMLHNGIPFYRKHKTNLSYKIKVVGFSESRSSGTFSQRNKRITGKSKNYQSNAETKFTDDNGIAEFVAPTSDDLQTIIVESDNGQNIIVNDIKVENDGSNMGTVALVDSDEYNLKVIGEVDESQKDNGIMYINKTYRLTISITNISDVVAETPSIWLSCSDNCLTLSQYHIGLISSLGAGGKKIINIEVTASTPGEHGINVHIRNVLSGKQWDDYIPLYFYIEDYLTINAMSELNSSYDLLRGFVICPNGESRYFYLDKYSSVTLKVPKVTIDDNYLLSLWLPYSDLNENKQSNFFYSACWGKDALLIDDEKTEQYINYAKNHSSEDNPYQIPANASIQASINAGEMVYYKLSSSTGTPVDIRVIPDYESYDPNDRWSYTDTVGYYDMIFDYEGLSKDGRHFCGYYTEPNGNGVMYVNENGKGIKTIDSLESLTLYAHYIPSTYTIIFRPDSNDRTAKDDYTVTVNYGEELVLPACRFNSPNENYEFGYWIGCESDFDVKEMKFNDCAIIKNLTKYDGRKIVLHPVWVETSTNYRIIYHNLLNADNKNNPYFFTDEDDINLADISAEGYVFNGWALDSSGDAMTLGWNGGEFTHDVDLWAIWTPNTYKVTIDSAYRIEYRNTTYIFGSEDKVITATSGESLPDIESPYSQWWSFGGYWTRKNGQGVQYIDANGYGSKIWDIIEWENEMNDNRYGDKRLFAYWIPNKLDDDGNIMIKDRVFKNTSLIKVFDKTTEFPGLGILKPYQIGKYEVTQELFEAVMGVNPSRYTGDLYPADLLGDMVETSTLLRPVDNVSFYEAIAFCNKLSIIMGKDPMYIGSYGIKDWLSMDYSEIPSYSKYIDIDTWDYFSDILKSDNDINGYRLPSAAEWDCAARGGVYSESIPWAYTYSGSNDFSEVAWMLDVSDDKMCHTWQTGLKKPNSLGIYDMTGNVWEWCDDKDAMARYHVLYADKEGNSHKVYGRFLKESIYSGKYAYPLSCNNNGFRIVLSATY